MIKSPIQGDILLVNLSPTAGHEQKGTQPVLVVSNSDFNKKTQMCMITPITSTSKGYPFEVIVDSKKTSGVILSDQIRTIDYHARKAQKVDTVTKDCLTQTLKKISLIFS